MTIFRSLILSLLAASLLLTGAARAQGSTPAAGDPPPLTAQELDSLLAPIALYPDPLLAQVLMASTYPLEVVQAARWSKANPKLSGDAAVKEVGDEEWDVSVMSLVAFPNVLEMMNEKLDWTQKVGDAFLGQQGEVMDSVQRLRKLAQNSGNLQSNEQQVVRSEAQAIVIEPAQPQTIYVPAYNPTVVYGAWPYPAYPPYYYPGVALWYPGAALVRGFAWGVGFAAAGAIFGGCNWGSNNVNVNVNRATSINRNYNRSSVGAGNSWQHNAQHRGNVGYRDSASQQKFGNKQAERSRDEFRGREGGERGGDRGGRDGVGGDRGGRDGVGGDRGGRDGVGGDRGGRDGAGGDRGGRDGVGGDRGGAGASNRGSHGDGLPGQGSFGGGNSGNRGNAFQGASSGNRDASRGHSSTAGAGRTGGGSSFAGGGGGRSFSGGGGRGGGGGGGRGGGGRR